MYITSQLFERCKTHSVRPQRSLHKTRLTSFQLLHSLHPPTFILPVSFHLCTDGQDCVYVYTSPAMLVYMYTFGFLLPPH